MNAQPNLTYQYQVGGSLPANSPTYVTRQADQDLYAALKATEFCYVLNSRQMGKSSLRVRTMQRLQQEGIACAAIDITAIGTWDITPEQWYAGVIDSLVGSLNFYDNFDLESWWNAHDLLSPVQRFSKFIEEVLLVEICQQIVIFVDEIDSVLSLSFPIEDFFAVIRNCYNQRADQPVYNRLTFALIGVATPSDLIADKKRTPFNIGRAIELQGFQPDEVESLTQGLVGKVTNPQAVMQEILVWTGGQPFLTQKLCQLIINPSQNPTPTPPLAKGRGDVTSNPPMAPLPVYGEGLGVGFYFEELGENKPNPPTPFPRREGGEFFDFVDGREFGGDILPPTRREVNIREWVEAVVKSRIVENWEFHDEPEHLRTIRDRILRNEQKACRWLGLYQQILQHGELECENSQEHMELRLTGLVVEREGKLKIYNRIYEAVFNQNWVTKALADLRPYAETLESWVAANKDESWLLRGQALQDAQAWATGKSLSDLDYQYLAASQELDKRQMQTALEAEKQARQILESARQKARRQTFIGAGILGLSLLGAVVVAVATEQARQRTFTAIEAERLGNNAIERFKWNQIDGLLMAMEAGQNLKSLVNQKQSIVDYPAFSPILSIQDILAQIQQKNSFGDSSGITSVSFGFSPDGKTIVLSSDNTIKLWDVTTGQPIKTLSGNESEKTIVFSPDGKIIASGGYDKTIKLWDVTTGKVVKTLSSQNNSIYELIFSPDGKILASRSYNNIIQLWDLTTGKVIKSLSEHTDLVNSIAFSPDGKILASGSSDDTIKLWDVTTGKAIKTLTGHVDRVTSVAFSADGNMIASGSDDKTIKLWDVTTGKAKTFTGNSSSVNSVALSQDGNMIVSGSFDKTIKLWDVTTDKATHTVYGHEISVKHVAFSPDGNLIASSGYDNKIKIWDFTNSQNIKTLNGHESRINTIGFSPDGKMLASGSADNTIKLWDAHTGKTTNSLVEHSAGVTSVVFSPDGKTIASGSGDRTIKLWDATTGKSITTLTGYDFYISSIGFSPDGKILAFGSGSRIKLWDIATSKEILTLSDHSRAIATIQFSPDGKILASGSDDKTIKLWDVATGKVIKTLTYGSSVTNIAFSPDGKILAAGSSDKTIKLWDIASGKVIKTLTGHSETVKSVVFSPDGKVVVSGSNDNTIKLWNVATGKEIRTLTGHTSAVTSLAFSSDGKVLASGSADKTIKLWRLNIDDVLSRGCSTLQQYLISHPDTLEKLKVCQNQSLFLAAAPTLVAQGEKLATEGKYKEAVAKFQKAKKWDSKLDINPQVKAAPAFVNQGIELANQGDFSGTFKSFRQAQKLDPKLDLDPYTEGVQDNAEFVAKQLAAEGLINKQDLIPKAQEYLKQGDLTKAVAVYTEIEKLQPSKETLANSWNTLCWEGSLRGYAKDVIFACEKAVSLTPDDGNIRDSRGLAKALTGDTKGAIEDFEAFIKWSDDPLAKAKRQGWIKDIRAGKNPFTPEELQKLQGE
jgi:WD40 repeat protein